VGRFRQPVIKRRDVPLSDFSALSEPGGAKPAANFSVAPYGNQHTFLSDDIAPSQPIRMHDGRSGCTTARRTALVADSAVVVDIMRATLNTIKADAEAAATDRAR
jgi:hypothetical protein